MKPPKCRLCEKSHWGNCAIQKKVQPKSQPTSKRLEKGVVVENTDHETLCGDLSAAPGEDPAIPQQKTDSGQEALDERSVPKQKEVIPRPGKVSTRSGGNSELRASKTQLADGPLTQVQRNRRWRQKNREKYNQYMRNYRSRK